MPPAGDDARAGRPAHGHYRCNILSRAAEVKIYNISGSHRRSTTGMHGHLKQEISIPPPAPRWASLSYISSTYHQMAAMPILFSPTMPGIPTRGRTRQLGQHTIVAPHAYEYRASTPTTHDNSFFTLHTRRHTYGPRPGPAQRRPAARHKAPGHRIPSAFDDYCRITVACFRSLKLF